MRLDAVSRRRAVTAVALLAGACQRESLAPSASPAHAPRAELTVPRPPASDAQRATTPVEPCRVAQAITDAAVARAEQHTRRVMDRLVASGEYTGPKLTGPIDSYVVSDWLKCLETPGGAWATVLVKAQLSPVSSGDWSGDFYLDGMIALVHVDRAGIVAETPIRTEASAQEAGGAFLNRELFAPELPNCCSFVFGGLEPPELFDFDGDGEPEIHVAASYGHEGVHDEWDALFTFRQGRIQPYAPAAGHAFREMKDETSDGIPDLLMSEHLSGGESCGSGFPSDGRGLVFIAHGLPGGAFSTDDDAARAYAKKQCPAAPAVIRSFSDVLCAKLWGRSSDELKRHVSTSFTAWDCAAELAGRAQPARAHADYALMLSAAASSIPFTLR